MKLPEEGALLRIFISERDRHEGKPLYEWLVHKARTDGLAGATVLRGMMGYGPGSRIHSIKILRLSDDLPIIIEFVDSAERLEAFLEQVGHTIQRGMATMEAVFVRIYRAS